VAAVDAAGPLIYGILLCRPAPRVATHTGPGCIARFGRIVAQACVARREILLSIVASAHPTRGAGQLISFVAGQLASRGDCWTQTALEAANSGWYQGCALLRHGAVSEWARLSDKLTGRFDFSSSARRVRRGI